MLYKQCPYCEHVISTKQLLMTVIGKVTCDRCGKVSILKNNKRAILVFYVSVAIMTYLISGTSIIPSAHLRELVFISFLLLVFVLGVVVSLYFGRMLKKDSEDDNK